MRFSRLLADGALHAAANRCGPDLDATFQPPAGGDSAEPLRIGADSVASHTGRDRTGLDGLLWSSHRTPRIGAIYGAFRAANVQEDLAKAAAVPSLAVKTW